jgi:hypothetical protein
MVVVTFNYRVGPYGFLAGEEIEKGASLNNGLKDQRKALKWVQKHISKVRQVVIIPRYSPGFVRHLVLTLFLVWWRSQTCCYWW